MAGSDPSQHQLRAPPCASIGVSLGGGNAHQKSPPLAASLIQYLRVKYQHPPGIQIEFFPVVFRGRKSSKILHFRSFLLITIKSSPIGKSYRIMFFLDFYIGEIYRGFRRGSGAGDRPGDQITGPGVLQKLLPDITNREKETLTGI